MRRRCSETARLALLWQQALRPMYAVRTDARGEGGVACNQQQQAAPSADGRQATRYACTIRRAEMTINQRGPAWEESREGKRIWGALWIGEKKQRWDCDRSRRAVEPCGQSR